MYNISQERIHRLTTEKIKFTAGISHDEKENVNPEAPHVLDGRYNLTFYEELAEEKWMYAAFKPEDRDELEDILEDGARPMLDYWNYLWVRNLLDFTRAVRPYIAETQKEDVEAMLSFLADQSDNMEVDTRLREGLLTTVFGHVSEEWREKEEFPENMELNNGTRSFEHDDTEARVETAFNTLEFMLRARNQIIDRVGEMKQHVGMGVVQTKRQGELREKTHQQAVDATILDDAGNEMPSEDKTFINIAVTSFGHIHQSSVERQQKANDHE